MPDIAITAAIISGDALLFEESPAGVLRLPRLPFTNEHDEIEQALAAHLNQRIGLEVVEQQFVDTVFERQPDGSVVVNNVQLITAWQGEVPPRDVFGIPLRWVQTRALASATMSDDLRETLRAALGEEEFDAEAVEQPTAQTAGRVIVLTGNDEDVIRLVAQNVPPLLGRCALVEIAAVRGLVRPGPADTPASPGFPSLMRRVRLLGLRNAAAIAQNSVAAGIDALLYGTFAETNELDALLAALLGVPTFVVQLTREGWRPDPRGMAVSFAPGGAGETASRIVAHLDAARVA